jgi:hypothetical protein
MAYLKLVVFGLVYTHKPLINITSLTEWETPVPESITGLPCSWEI